MMPGWLVAWIVFCGLGLVVIGVLSAYLLGYDEGRSDEQCRELYRRLDDVTTGLHASRMHLHRAEEILRRG